MANSENIEFKFKFVSDFSDIAGDVNQIQKMLNKLKLPTDQKLSFSNIFDDLAKEQAKYQKYLDSGFKKKGDVTGLEASGERLDKLFKKLSSELAKISLDTLQDSFQIDTSALDELNRKLQEAKDKLAQKINSEGLSNIKKQAVDAAAEMSKLSKTKFTGEFLEAFKKGDFEGATKALEQLALSHKAFKDETKEIAFAKYWEDMVQALTDLQGHSEIQDLTNDIVVLKGQIQTFNADQWKQFFGTFVKNREEVERLTDALKKFFNQKNLNANSKFNISSEVDALKGQVEYFFGLTNTIQIFKNAVRDAISTVKELDAVMTETAVVTDFSIGDMWDKLPEYSKQATKLGASISSLYEATTLYYQQGLNSQQAMAVGTETMKMARIANMDAVDATTAMTAALRGFNMEINEMSATRVNDVYSELAAITAADTSQIAKAMGKTASIAASANMEFETTAALLAQIIETTQEAPETAGTAMKTIIARFTEVKKLFSEGMLSGEDTEGEEININKIDEALKSVGISLKDFLNGTKGIDDIFLELASKWDTLDLATQRYIATAAAGSRQQSRFIAMMSNYDRTMELVNAANNSAGASQKQFGKTLDSLEAKLQKLENAWNTFVMGLANSDAIKMGVDLLTKLLETLNDMTDNLGDVAGGFAKLTMVVAGLKTGKGIFDSLFDTKGVGGKAKELSAIGSLVGTAFSKMGKSSAEGLKLPKEELDRISSQFSTATKHANLLGVSLGALGQFLRACGWEKAAKGAEMLGGGIILLANAMNALNTVAEVGFETNLAGLFAILAGALPTIFTATVAIGSLAAVFYAIYSASPGGQLKAAQKATEQAGQAAEEAAKNYEELKTSLSDIGSHTNDLDNLTRGTQEWRDAVFALNQEVSNLLEKYPELSNFVSMENGVLTIDYKKEVDGETANDVIRKTENAAIDASIIEQLRKIAELQLQQKSIPQEIRKALEAALPSMPIAREYVEPQMEATIKILLEDWFSGKQPFYDQGTLDEWLSKKGYNSNLSYEDLASLLDTYAGYQSSITGYQNIIVGSATSQIDTQDVSQEAQEAVYGTSEEILNQIYKAQKGAEGQVTAADYEAYAEKHGLERKTIGLVGGIGGSYTYYTDESGKAVEVTDEQVLGMKSDNYVETLNNLASTLDEATSSQLQLYSQVFGNEALSWNNLLKYGNFEDGEYSFAENRFDALAKDMNFGNWENLVNQMNLNGEGAKEFIQKAFSEGYTEFIAKAMRSSGGGKQNLFKAFSISEEYEEVNTKLKELVETQGEITGADIDSLASEYKSLERLIEDTGVSASAMASIFEDIQNGSLTFDNLTDSLLSAIGTMNVLEEATNRTLKRLKELNLGQDTGEIKDIYGNFAGEVSDYVSSGEYNNERLKEIFKYIYGEDWDRKEDGSVLSDDERIAYINKLNKQTQQNFGENMLTAWHTAAGGKTLTGENVSPEALARLEKAGITLNQLSDGSIDFQISDDVDFGEAAHLLSETFEGSEEVWQDLMSYLQVVSPEFQKTSEIREAKTAGERAAEEVTPVGGKVLLTQEEIDKANKEISEIRDKYGLTKEEIPDYVAQLEASLGKGIEVEVLPTISEENKDELVGIFSKMFSPDGKSLDISGLVSTLKSLGISDVMAEQIAEGVINGVGDGGEITQTIDGESFTISKEDALAAIKEAFSYAEEVIQEENITVAFDHGPVDELSNYMDGTLGKKSYSINFHPKLKPFGEYAKGTPHAPRSGESLVGEKGPELIETRGGAYLSGLNGPEIFPVNKGDIVHTAQETRKIFRAKGKMMPAFSDGWGATIPGSPSGEKGSGRGGSGSGAGDKDAWENPFDKLYNLVRNIDEELRQRERIERRYEKLLKSLDVSANKIVAINREELAQLEKERELQEELVRGREWQIQQYLKENQDLLKYANVEKNDRGENVLRIDWDAINAVRDSELGARIEEYVSQLEEWFDSLQDAEEALWDIEDAVEEIKDRGKDQYLDLEDRIKEALIQSYQDEIDKLSEINDSINDTNASLLDAIQTSIDKQRQDRENAETEADLAEKQRRLAYLQQDTSGANAMEILKLEEEIREGQQDYTDSLIDQKISELQQQNDEAAKQREQQISIMQAQLDQYIKSGEIWNEVHQLMRDGLDEENGLITGSRLEDILKKAEGFIGLSEIGKMEWLSEIERQIAEALAYLKTGRQLEDIGIGGMQNFSFIDENGQERTGYVDEDGNVFTEDEEGNFVGYSDVYQGADGKYYAGSGPELIWEGNNTFPYGRPSEQGDLRPGSKGDPVKSLQHALHNLGFLPFQNITGNYDVPTEHAVNAVRRWQGISPEEGFFDGKVRDKLRLLGYKTGGLADFTGPAWLDGTKAHPELVLSARDTQNFIQLKDILGSLMNHPINSSPTENNGDTSFDIDINVENIGSDYDVEQMAAKVKSLINQDARYRNNNAVSLMR